MIAYKFTNCFFRLNSVLLLFMVVNLGWLRCFILVAVEPLPSSPAGDPDAVVIILDDDSGSGGDVPQPFGPGPLSYLSCSVLLWILGLAVV